MHKNDFILELYKRRQTVFTIGEIAMLFPDISYNALKSKIHYFVKTNRLQSLRRGIYSKESYDPYELAIKIYTPAYISFETALQKEGMNFQYDTQIYVASILSRTVITKTGETIIYHKMSRDIISDPRGLVINPNYAIAGKERVFLDVLYLYRNFHFDNLDLDWDKVWEFLPLYHNKNLGKRARQYYKIYREESNV